MELKDISFLSVRNIVINFFGSLVVSQDVAKEVDDLLLLALKSEWENEEGIEENL